MVDLDRRIRVATLLRELGHEFMSREIPAASLDELAAQVEGELDQLRATPLRERMTPGGAFAGFSTLSPAEGKVQHHRFFVDSVVSGGANPMGLGALLWRDGETAVMETTLGRAFEGAPGRSHGGVIAALVDEAMGSLMGMRGELAFTARLTIDFRSPTPLNEPVTARAWLAERDGRKLTLRASVHAGELLVAEADALFIAVDPAKFLDQLNEE